MKQYLEERIEHLKNVEWEYFEKSIDLTQNYEIRNVYRRFSNEFEARRNECEQMLNFLNGKTQRE